MKTEAPTNFPQLTETNKLLDIISRGAKDEESKQRVVKELHLISRVSYFKDHGVIAATYNPDRNMQPNTAVEAFLKMWDAFNDNRITEKNIDLIRSEGFSRVLGIDVPPSSALRGKTAESGGYRMSSDPVKDAQSRSDAEHDDRENIKKLLNLMVETHKNGSLIKKLYQSDLR